MLEDNKFPVLGKTGSVKFVKWDMLSDKWALNNHRQSLVRLAERGGLSWAEIYSNYYRQPFDSPIDPKLYSSMVDRISC